MARRRSGKKIDFTHWTYGSATATALSAGAAAVTLFSAIHLSETFLRFRGEWTAYLDSTSAPGIGLAVTAGMILVPEGTGTTVLWDPVVDGDAPWMWWDTFHLGYEEMVTDVVDIPGITFGRRVIDSKAMRIVRNQEVQVVFNNATILSADAVNVQLSGRSLSGT